MASLKEQFKTTDEVESKTKPTVRRKRRAQLNGRNVLTVEGKEDGYVYRVVNDEGGRVERLKEIGYEVVLDREVRIGDRRVATPTAEGSAATVHVGSGLKGVVMRQRKEYYDEDQAEKLRYVNETEASMRKQAREQADYGKLDVGSGKP
jgi:hypothetical protein